MYYIKYSFIDHSRIIEVNKNFGTISMLELVLQGGKLSASQISQLEAKFDSTAIYGKSSIRLAISVPLDKKSLAELREKYSCDVNILPSGFDPKKVKMVISDMDSTLISIECIDEIADYANIKDKVSEITEQAMRGELDFAQSLTARVKLLAGLDESALQKVYDDRLNLNPGAEEMLAALKANDIKFTLVSGGFTFFTDRLKPRLGIDYTLANTLERKDGKLTGAVVGDIVGAEAKAEFLLARCDELGISPSQVLAIGDGANDLKMMSVAGVGVAYYAKPKVQLEADCALNHTGLEGLIGLLGLD